MCSYGYSYCECKEVQTVCAIGPDPDNNLIVEQEVMAWYADKCDRRYCTCSNHPDYNTRLNELLKLENINIVNNNITLGPPAADEEIEVTEDVAKVDDVEEGQNNNDVAPNTTNQNSQNSSGEDREIEGEVIEDQTIDGETDSAVVDEDQTENETDQAINEPIGVDQEAD